jgi:hypothetical protein
MCIVQMQFLHSCWAQNQTNMFQTGSNRQNISDDVGCAFIALELYMRAPVRFSPHIWEWGRHTVDECDRHTKNTCAEGISNGRHCLCFSDASLNLVTTVTTTSTTTSVNYSMSPLVTFAHVPSAYMSADNSSSARPQLQQHSAPRYNLRSLTKPSLFLCARTHAHTRTGLSRGGQSIAHHSPIVARLLRTAQMSNGVSMPRTDTPSSVAGTLHSTPINLNAQSAVPRRPNSRLGSTGQRVTGPPPVSAVRGSPLLSVPCRCGDIYTYTRIRVQFHICQRRQQALSAVYTTIQHTQVTRYRSCRLPISRIANR